MGDTATNINIPARNAHRFRHDQTARKTKVATPRSGDTQAPAKESESPPRGFITRERPRIKSSNGEVVCGCVPMG